MSKLNKSDTEAYQIWCKKNKVYFHYKKFLYIAKNKDKNKDKNKNKNKRKNKDKKKLKIVEVNLNDLNDLKN